MKALISFIQVLLMFLISHSLVFSQTPVLVEWNFEDEAKRTSITNSETFQSNPYTADNGSVENINIRNILLGGDANFSEWVQGSGGSGTFAPNAVNWNNGNNSKYWQVSFSSLGFERLTVSSRQRGSGTGPRDFKLQYSLNETDWEDINDSNIIVADNFSSGNLNNIPLPDICSDQETIYLRWVMNSNISVNGNSVGSSGTNRIDDIIVRGFRICNKHESFFNSELQASYTDGSFVGDDGIIWEYFHSRNEGDYPIEGKGIILRSQGDNSKIQANITGGIQSFSVDMRKAFTWGTTRQLGLYINGELIDVSQTFGGVSGLDESIYTFQVNGINIPGDLVLEIRNIRGTNSSPSHLTIDNIQWSCYLEPVCETTFFYYQSIGSGDWESPSIWQASENGDTWSSANCPPDYRATEIKIQSGDTIIINDFLRLDHTLIEQDALLIRVGGELILADGPGDNIIVEGVFRHAASLQAPKYEGNSSIRIKPNGMLEITNNQTSSSHYGTSENIFYEDEAVFYWNVSSNAIFQTNGIVYFPNSDDSTIPVFRINTPNINLGGNSTTTINGLLEVESSNITFQNSGTKIFRNGITGSGTVTQANSSGVFIINGNTAQLGGSGSLILDGTGMEISSADLQMISDKTVSSSGPVIITGTFNANTHTLSLGSDLTITAEGSFDSGSSTLVFNGITPQTFQSALETDFFNLALNNPADLTLNSAVTIENILELTEGNIINDNATITLGTSTDQTGQLILLNGAIKGKFQRYISNIADEEWIFPVARDLQITPVEIRFTVPPTEGGVLLAEFITDIPDDFYGNLPIQDEDLEIDILWDEGFWNIERLHGLEDGVYDISLGVSDSLAARINNTSNVRIIKRESSETDWDVAGNFESADYEYIKHTGINTGFSEFAVGSNFLTNPLPIELLHFTAEIAEKFVKLNWATASEINNDFFTLERSTDMRNIEVIGHTPGAGNSNTVLRYSYTDHDPHPGISYYRLKQTDYDGSYEYSDWIAVRVNAYEGKDLEILRLFQLNGSVFMLLQTQPNSNLEIRVSDIYGREVQHERMHSASETIRYSFVPNTTGLIFITISDGQKRVSGRLVIR